MPPPSPPPPAAPPPPEPPPSPSPPWWLEDCGAGSAPQQGDGCAKCPSGWYGTVDDRTGETIRKCEPCPSGWLQPLPGQSVCLPCPDAGVDCGRQNRIEVLEGWYRPATSVSAADVSTFELSFTLAGDIDQASEAAVETGLRS